MESSTDQAPAREIPVNRGAPEERPQTGLDEEEEAEGPPLDDVCPICFSEFTIPCKSACGHWYCAFCILEYWNHSTKPSPCKCPMCSRKIMKLIPDVSLLHQHDEEVVKALKDVHSYNLLLVGGRRGAVQKLSSYINRHFQRWMEPEGIFFSEIRLFSMLLGLLYLASPLNFIPPGVGITRVCDIFAVILFIILHIIGYLRRRRLERRVRQLGNMQLHRE